jgi:hypothetical protein
LPGHANASPASSTSWLEPTRRIWPSAPMSVSLPAAGPHCAMPASNTIRASAYSSTSAQLLAKISHGSAALLDSAVARRVFLASLIKDSSTGLGAFAPKPRDAGAAEAGFFFFCLVFCLASIVHTGWRAIGAGIRSAEAAASSAAANSKKRCMHSRLWRAAAPRPTRAGFVDVAALDLRRRSHS